MQKIEYTERDKGTDDELRDSLVASRETLQKLLDRSELLRSRTAMIADRKQQLAAEQERQAQNARERESFKGVIDSVLAMDQLSGILYTQSERAGFHILNEQVASPSKKRDRKVGRKVIERIVHDDISTQEDLDEITAALIEQGYKPEDIDTRKLYLMILMKRKMGGKTFKTGMNVDEPKDGAEKKKRRRRDPHYFTSVFDYQGYRCTVSESAIYGHATYVYIEHNGKVWREVLVTPQQARAMGSQALNHPKVGVCGFISDDDHKRHFRRIEKKVNAMVDEIIARETSKLKTI